MSLEYYWKQLETQILPEQVFFIMVLLTFVETEQVKQDMGSRPLLCKESVAEAIRSIPDYDFKESVLKLSEKIEWELLEQDAIVYDVKELKGYIFETLRRAKKKSVLLQQSQILQGQIWTLAERDGLLMPTPSSVLRLMEELFGEMSVNNMLDMCSGTSYMGYTLWETITSGNQHAFYTGVETDPVLCSIAHMMFHLNGAKRCGVIRRDILEAPDGKEIEQYDFIFADIPRGNNRSIVCDGSDSRTRGFGSKKIYADWIFIQNMLACLKEGGYAVALVTSGALIRKNEKQLRMHVVEKDWLEAVISLPANLYTNVHTATELLVFHKGKQRERQNKILFMDISTFRERQGRNAYDISEEGIRMAGAAFCEYKELDDVSVICTKEVLEQEMLSWKPLNYLKGAGVHDKMTKLEKVAGIVRGAQIKPEEIRVSEGGVKFINVKDIQNEQICYDTAENVDETRLATKPQFRVREDDILITSKGTLIKIAIAKRLQEVGYISGNITILRVNRDIYHPYVLYDYLQSKEGYDALERIQSGTTIRILNNTNLKNLDIPAYPHEIMEEIGEELRRNQLDYDRKQRELTETFLKQKEQLQRKLKRGAVEDGKNIPEP